MNGLSNVTSSMRGLVPSSLRQFIKKAKKDYLFRHSLREIAALPSGETPTRRMLSNLLVGWENKRWVAKYDYLEEVARRAATTRGPILECGSGLTTILLGLLAGRRGVETWSLEHLPEWHSLVTGAIQRHHIPAVHVCLSPLRDYGEFSWYSPPLARLPETFSLVICDGPPHTTPGGRYGLMSVLGGRLAKDALILLDDANRKGETEVLCRWSAETGTRHELCERPTGTYALVTTNKDSGFRIQDSGPHLRHSVEGD